MRKPNGVHPPSLRACLRLLCALSLVSLLSASGGCRRFAWRAPEPPPSDAGQPKEAGTPDKKKTPLFESLAPTVLLISLDGFRWDYFEKANTPNMDRLRKAGVQADALIPVFPSKTFPNHYSIATGLHPEKHGIVGNSMYDPVFGSLFKITDSLAVSDGRWWGGEPIWVTAVKQGQRAAAMFWTGSEAEIKGVRPTYWRVYQSSMPASDRIGQLMQWLELPAEQRPSFLTLYFSDVDHQGHSYGPESAQVVAAVELMDQHIGLLIKELEARKLLDRINIILVSDHGMAGLSPERVIVLNEYIKLEDANLVEMSSILSLNPKPGKADAVYQQLKGKHPNLHVYRREEMPEHFHYRAHRRIPEIIGLSDPGWFIVADHASRLNISLGGTHGYDHRDPSMHGIFVAHGPAFKQRLRVPAFQCVEIYNLMAHILKLKPAPNDGDFNIVKPILR